MDRRIPCLLCLGAIMMAGSAWAADPQRKALEDAYRAGVLSESEYQRKLTALDREASGEKQKKLEALENARRAGVISEEDYKRKRDALDPEPEVAPQSPIFAGSDRWLLNGATLRGGSAFMARFGWPGISLDLMTSMGDTFDLGGTFTFNYGLEGTVNIVPGIKLAGLLRLNLLDTGKFNLGLRTTPGLLLYFPTNNAGTVFGLNLPVDLVAGLVLAPTFSLHFGLSLPLSLAFTPNFAFMIPIEPGVGLEFKASQELTIGLDTSFGPVIAIANQTAVVFGFKTQLAVGYAF